MYSASMCVPMCTGVPASVDTHGGQWNAISVLPRLSLHLIFNLTVRQSFSLKLELTIWPAGP